MTESGRPRKYDSDGLLAPLTTNQKSVSEIIEIWNKMGCKIKYATARLYLKRMYEDGKIQTKKYGMFDVYWKE